MTDVRDDLAKPILQIALFGAIALLIAGDLLADWRSGTDLSHLVVELVVLALATAGAVVLWRETFAARRTARALRRDLQAARADLERWKEEARDALRGLGAAIGRQFARWALTDAERAVGLAMLKGMSHKEIAAERDTSERTVRQQALAVYRKAGVGGRAALSAFFLEGLFLPGPGAAGAP